MNSPILELNDPKFLALKQKLSDFVEFECIPSEEIYESQLAKHPKFTFIPPVIEALKIKAKSLGLWNLFLPSISSLTNLEYAVLCEITGRSHLAPEATNCAAPDTGNMEVLHLYGSPAQKDKWLKPLLEGSIRSAFCMTEPDVASSDARNIQLAITRNQDGYILNGTKWSSGAGDPRCALYIVAGKTTFDGEAYKQQSVVLVPAKTPGVEVVRHLSVYGYDESPHGRTFVLIQGHMEIHFNNVLVPFENIVGGEGRGFEIMQGRLGPGRIHHCMRSLGVAERALEAHLLRVSSRKAFGKMLSEFQTGVAESRIEIDAARLLVLNAAAGIDKDGAKKAMNLIAMAKVVVPSTTLRVIDRAVQAHGGAGVSDDFPLAKMWAGVRTLRIADGPDEVHLRQIQRNEMKRITMLREVEEKRGAIKKAKL